MTPSIEEALHRHRLTEKHLKEVVRRVQKTCKHIDLAECGYHGSPFGSALPPMRVCLRCGLTEDGWGCGYIVLKGAAAAIRRDDLYSKRLGLMINDAHKGPLLRGEITLAALIDLEGDLPKHLRETNDL